MYSLLGLGARYSFLALAVSLLSGCGGSSAAGPPPEGIQLNAGAITDAPECRSAEEISDEPFVYRCDTGAGPVFISSLQDCSVPEKFSFQATTRQLFVGATGLTVLSQAPVTVGERQALQTLVSATLDAQPLTISTFTFREGRCVTDLVVWRAEKSPARAGSASQAFASLSLSLAQQLLGDSLELGHGEG